MHIDCSSLVLLETLTFSCCTRELLQNYVIFPDNLICLTAAPCCIHHSLVVVCRVGGVLHTALRGIFPNTQLIEDVLTNINRKLAVLGFYC